MNAPHAPSRVALASWAVGALLAALLLAAPSPAHAKGVGGTCGWRGKCNANLSCERSPILKRCVPNANSYAEGTVPAGHSCYDNTDCADDLICRGGRDNQPHKRTCQAQPVTDVSGLQNGDVFPCACNSKSFAGGTMVKTSSVYSADADNGRLIVKFSDGNVIKNDAARRFLSAASWLGGLAGFFVVNAVDWGGLFLGCKCAIVDDLTYAWEPSDGGRDGKGYATTCVGFCGAHCGEDMTGITTARKRFGGLIKHDICQAYIGSTAAIYQLDGLTNACADEGITGGLTGLPSSITSQPGACTDGPEPVFPELDPPSGAVQLRAGHSAKCLAVDAATGGVVQTSCDVGDASLFELFPSYFDGTYTLVNLESGNCLAVADGSTDGGALIIDGVCDDSDATRFVLDPVEGGGVALIAEHSGACVDIRDESQADGASAIQSGCHGGANQTFELLTE